jgi:hypothetical protein
MLDAHAVWAHIAPSFCHSTQEAAMQTLDLALLSAITL